MSARPSHRESPVGIAVTCPSRVTSNPPIAAYQDTNSITLGQETGVRGLQNRIVTVNILTYPL